MELHFCSQCGISIPFAEVQSGAASVDGRFVCSEHRTPSGPLAKGSQPEPGSAGSDFELLFCANCQVSIPAADLHNDRAKREFGSLLCATCTVADTPERDRRKKAVEAAMAKDSPAPPDTAETRRCGICSTPVPQSQLDAGRAILDGDRVICPHCREAGAVARSRPVPVGAGAPSWMFVGLFAVAVGTAAFFGTAYFRAQRPAGQSAGEKDTAGLRADMAAMGRTLGDLKSAMDRRADEQRDGSQQSFDVFQARIAEDLGALRDDLTEVRSRLTATDNDLAQRVARLEGQIGGISEMVKGLAARPSGGGGEMPRTPPAPGPTAGNGGGEAVRPPVTTPPAGDPPAPPPTQPPMTGPDPAVVKLIKDMLESKEEGTRFTAAYELIRRKERSAIAPFATVLVNDTNVMVRRAAARGLGELRAWNAVPALIQALEDREAYVAQQANFALQAITGTDFGVSIDDPPRVRKTKAVAAAKAWEKTKDNPPDGVCLEPATLKP